MYIGFTEPDARGNTYSYSVNHLKGTTHWYFVKMCYDKDGNWFVQQTEILVGDTTDGSPKPGSGMQSVPGVR